MANWTTQNITLSPFTASSGAAGQQLSIGSTGISIFGETVPSHVKKYEVFEIEQDVLLLSVVWQRLRKERESGTRSYVPVSTVIDKVLFENITPEDVERTNLIRDYYSKKLTWWVLNDIRLSAFREDMRELILGNGKVFQEKMKPLAYRLPEFYDYDVKFDEISSLHHTQVKKHSNHSQTIKKHLTLEHVFTRKRRSLSLKEYWFVDEDDNLNTLTINKDNQLGSLLDLHVKKPFDIEAVFTVKVRDNRQYCVLEKYSFL